LVFNGCFKKWCSGITIKETLSCFMDIILNKHIELLLLSANIAVLWNIFKLQSASENPLAKYIVQVIIENKPYINDPEGETIHRDLVVKGGYSSVQSVRSAKMLKMAVTAKSEKEAEATVKKLCEELRIFNPVVSNCTVQVSDKL